MCENGVGFNRLGIVDFVAFTGDSMHFAIEEIRESEVDRAFRDIGKVAPGTSIPVIR